MKSIATDLCIFALSLLLLAGCGAEQKALGEALELAGENGVELRRVLEHYRDDPMKLEAARYLIRNMPGHHQKYGDAVDRGKDLLARADSSRGYMPDSPEKREVEAALGSLPRVSDISAITSRMLIENINMAFMAWEENPWKDEYSIEEFCEWVLPYRVGDEPLENWRRVYHDRYRPVLDSLYTGSDIVEAADCLSRYLSRTADFALTQELGGMPHQGALFLDRHLVGTCREITDHALYVFRALGFPVAVDRYIFSPSHRHGHVWNVLLTPGGGMIPFWYTDPIEKGVMRGNDDGRKKGKVYRSTFSRCEGPSTLLTGIFSRDVSAEYFGGNSHYVPVEDEGDSGVMIAVSSRTGYVPVGICRREGKGTVRVEDVEEDVVFQTVVAGRNGLEPAGFPFMIHGGNVGMFTPDTCVRETAALTRKYPLQAHILKYMSWMTGGRITGSRTGNFRDELPICNVSDTPRMQMNWLRAERRGPFRAVRFYPPDGYRTEVAQLEVYSSGRRMVPEKVEGAAPHHGDPASGASSAVDGDWSTFYYSHEPNGVLELAFGSATTVDSILFVPRSDDNFIRPGDRYELLWQDGRRGWRSLGSKVADSCALVYDNIPRNALLLLRNHTRGSEEQVFHIKDGRQCFMRDRDRE